MKLNPNTWALLCVFVFFQIEQVFAQQSPSALPIAANASVAHTKRWQAFHNPAILAKSTKPQASIYYTNRFQLKELSTKALSFALPTKALNIGFAASYFGYEQYHEMQGGLALAKSFSQKFAIGLQANYYSIYLSPEVGYRGTIVTQIGLLSEVSKDFFVGFHAFNPAQSIIAVGQTEKHIPSVFSLGTSYMFGEQVCILAQLDKEIYYDLQWRLGVEYLPIEQLTVRVGGYGNPFVPSLGTSLILKSFSLDVNFERHPSLGINSACGLTYEF